MDKYFPPEVINHIFNYYSKPDSWNFTNEFCFVDNDEVQIKFFMYYIYEKYGHKSGLRYHISHQFGTSNNKKNTYNVSKIIGSDKPIYTSIKNIDMIINKYIKQIEQYRDTSCEIVDYFGDDVMKYDAKHDIYYIKPNDYASTPYYTYIMEREDMNKCITSMEELLELFQEIKTIIEKDNKKIKKIDSDIQRLKKEREKLVNLTLT